MAAISNAAKSAAARRSRPLRLALMAALAAATLQASGRAFSALPHASGVPRTRGNLPAQVLEIREEPVEESAPAEPMPDYRPPYTLNLVTHFPNGKHVSEDKVLYKYLEAKVFGSLEHVDELVKHVELKLSVEDHFHKEKDGHKKVVESPINAIQKESGEIVEVESNSFGKTGHQVLAPYQIKVVVSLKNGKDVIYSNPEKHAEHSLTECADGMADGVRRLLREEKNKVISERRHQDSKRASDGDLDLDGDEVAVVDTIGEAEDAKMEEIYAAIDAQK